MPSMKVTFLIKNNYVDIIKKETYEPILLKVINKSSSVFLEKYKYSIEQSHGESDYIGEKTFDRLDAKLLFEQKICHLISKGQNELNSWLAKMSNNMGEIFDSIMKIDNEEIRKEKIVNSIVYKEIFERLKNLDKNESLLLFIPFFISLKFENSIFSHIGSDNIDVVMGVLIKKEYSKLKGRKVYIVYPNFENKVILKKLFNGKKQVYGEIEFIKIKDITNYISVQDLNPDSHLTPQ